MQWCTWPFPVTVMVHKQRWDLGCVDVPVSSAGSPHQISCLWAPGGGHVALPFPFHCLCSPNVLQRGSADKGTCQLESAAALLAWVCVAGEK